MEVEKKALTITLPKLDSFDLFALLLWFGILIPAVQLPSSATYTFARSVFFIIWVALFSLFVGIRIIKEKRLFFYSAGVVNYLMLGLGVSFIVSFLLSASRLDSLFGYDLSFGSSFLVSISLVVMYFLLKLAGLSLEYAVSRLLSVFPFALVVIDLLQVLLLALSKWVLRDGSLNTVLGNYGQYFSFLTSNILGLSGNVHQALVLHLVAVVIIAWQISVAYTRETKESSSLYRRIVAGILLGIATSYLFALTLSLASVSVLTVTTVAVLAVYVFGTNNQLKKFGYIYGALLVLMLLIVGVWWKIGLIGEAKQVTITSSESSTIIQKSYQDTGIPMWRQLVGFGTGTFPYLYMKYRGIESSQKYGNATYFFKPANFVGELFIENGLLSLLMFSAVIGAVAVAYKKASLKKALGLEVTLMVLLITTLLTAPSSLPILVLLFVIFASFFDKVETLPEILPSIRAVDIKESTYTNKSVSRVGVVLLIASILYAAAMLLVLITSTMTMVGYARSLQRFAVAQSQVSDKPADALKSFSDSYSMATSYRKYCKECSQLSYLSLSALSGTNDLYGRLTEEQQANSTELRQIRNLLLQASTELLGTSTIRYDYWLAVSQSFQTIANAEKSTYFYTQTLLSIRNSLAVNPYSVEANYLYVDTLLRLGNDAETNKLIYERLAIIKSLVGTPYQIQFLDSIMLAREKKYDDAIAAFEQIKKEVSKATNLSADEVRQLSSLADARAAEVKKLKETPVTTPTTTVRPSITPTPSATL